MERNPLQRHPYSLPTTGRTESWARARILESIHGTQLPWLSESCSGEHCESWARQTCICNASTFYL